MGPDPALAAPGGLLPGLSEPVPRRVVSRVALAPRHRHRAILWQEATDIDTSEESYLRQVISASGGFACVDEGVAGSVEVLDGGVGRDRGLGALVDEQVSAGCGRGRDTSR